MHIGLDIFVDVAIELRRCTRLGFVVVSLNVIIDVIAIVFSVYIISVEHLTGLKTKKDTSDQQPDPGNVPGPCSSGPCANQGKCANMSPREYICSCPAAYFGRHCEQGNKIKPI